MPQFLKDPLLCALPVVVQRGLKVRVKVHNGLTSAFIDRVDDDLLMLVPQERLSVRIMDGLKGFKRRPQVDIVECRVDGIGINPSLCQEEVAMLDNKDKKVLLSRAQKETGS